MATKKANKNKILETVKLDINKEYGEGSIMSLGGTDTLAVSYTHLTLPTKRIV